VPVESGAQYITQLNPAAPDGAEPMRDGDEHIRLIKDTMLRTFPTGSRAFQLAEAAERSGKTVVPGSYPYFVVSALPNWDNGKVILIDTSSGDKAVNLPLSSAVPVGFRVVIKKNSSTQYSIIVKVSGTTDRIDRTLTQTLIREGYQTMVLQAYSGGWTTISKGREGWTEVNITDLSMSPFVIDHRKIFYIHADKTVVTLPDLTTVPLGTEFIFKTTDDVDYFTVQPTGSDKFEFDVGAFRIYHNAHSHYVHVRAGFDSWWSSRRRWRSPNITPPNAQSVVQSHFLGGPPIAAGFFMRCLIANHTYDVGDLIVPQFTTIVSCWADQTTVKFAAKDGLFSIDPSNVADGLLNMITPNFALVLWAER
jgi:hypothetical protein